MDKFRYSLIGILASVGVGLNQAAMADEDTDRTAKAIIDWSQLKLSVTGINDSLPKVTYTNQDTSLSSSASSPGQSEENTKSINSWTTSANTNADAGLSSSSALASALSFEGNAVSLSGSASSSGDRTVNFFVNGPGVITATVPYTISLTGDTSDCYYCYNYDHASVSGSANFYSDANHGTSSSNSNASFSLDNNYWSHSPQSQSGTLVFGIFASGAGTGSLDVNYNLSVSAVPEPESYTMLLAGLGLMGAVIRRRGVNRRS
jgi:PEP-CTERM motif